MKKFNVLMLVLIFAGTALLARGQEQPTTGKEKKTPNTNRIHGGFYIKFGGNFPVGEFTSRHANPYHYAGKVDTIAFNAAKMGGALDLGFLIYIGPSFANHRMRLGIDATFLTTSFNPTDQKLPANSSSSKKYEYWYYFGGQKFGPLLTINPVDKLMIDLSWKLNATAAWYNSMWGLNLTNQEVSLGVRYSLIVFAFQYNYGRVKFTYNHDDNPTYWVDNTTYRIMVGFKF